MKIVKSSEMVRIERLAYDQGACEETFMNQAGFQVAQHIQHFIARYHLKPMITLLCGSGNNAGDAYVAGSILCAGGFEVNALALSPYENNSSLCQLQSTRFIESGGTIEYISDPSQISFCESALLVDGILGTGFHGEMNILFSKTIQFANRSGIPIIAVDIPSGVNGTTGEVNATSIEAKETVFLGLPKTGCFFGNAWNHIGKLAVYDFGLDPTFIKQAEPDFMLINDELIQDFFPPIVRNRHKYQAGYVVGIGGSIGMAGAPLMSSLAALRTGCGMMRLFHPVGMELGSAPLEVICQAYKEGDTDVVLSACERANSCFIGPGLGVSPSHFKFLKKILDALDCPCVIDADALTMIADHKIIFPSDTVITPHFGEMKRLLGLEQSPSIETLLEKAQEYVEEHQVILVLKGAPSFILSAEQKPFVCAKGDPGMATAGSGDVLTGMIAAFLAQVHDPFQAAVLGVYLHAKSGEYAAETHTSYCMIASDIIEALPKVFADTIQQNARGLLQER